MSEQPLGRRVRRLARRVFGSPLVMDVARRVRGPIPPPPEPPPPPPDPDLWTPTDRPLGLVEGRLETLEDEVHQVCFVEGKYPEGWITHPRCPCCDGPNMRPVFKKYGLSHSECEHCTFTFVQPYPPDALLERLYNAAYYPAVRRYVELPRAKANDRGMLFSFPEETLLRIIAHASQGRSEGRWLEYGGGLGHFAHLIQERLPSWSVVLSDMNRDSLAFAAETYRLSTLAATTEALEGQTFEVISMIASLEHIARPHALLESLVAHLAPGGLLVLAVPRFSPLNRAGSKDGSASVAPPYHLSHFDERSLARLLARLPALETEGLVAWQDPPNAFRLTDLVKSWPYWRVEIPTSERKTPRSGKVGAYSADEVRWLNALGVADAAVEDLLFAIDGGLHLTMIAQKRGAFG